eukprot:scaffold30372_cov38-Phaeocystis_antarctica.AAC.4
MSRTDLRARAAVYNEEPRQEDHYGAGWMLVDQVHRERHHRQRGVKGAALRPERSAGDEHVFRAPNAVVEVDRRFDVRANVQRRALVHASADAALVFGDARRAPLASPLRRVVPVLDAPRAARRKHFLEDVKGGLIHRGPRVRVVVILDNLEERVGERVWILRVGSEPVVLVFGVELAEDGAHEDDVVLRRAELRHGRGRDYVRHVAQRLGRIFFGHLVAQA